MRLPFLRRLWPALVLLLATQLPAQPVESVAARGSARFPAQLIERTLNAFAHASPQTFDSLYPFPDARQLVRWAVEAGWPRTAAGGRLISDEGGRAVIALSGHPITGSSGYETSLGRMFTGLYEARRDSTGWRLTRRLPQAMGNRIRSHRASVLLQPGEGLRVMDSLRIHLGESGGIWLTLNSGAELSTVELNGRPARYESLGGLLRIEAEAPGDAWLCLAYDLDLRRDSVPNANFGRFEPEFGHVRDQYYWLPFFGFDAAESVADFRLTLSAPTDVHVVTGLLQRDTIIAGRRAVVATSARPTAAITLMYDRRWARTRRPLGGAAAELFLTDSVEPSRQAIDSALTSVHGVLSRRFGDPNSGYVALVQGRALGGWGWLFRSNDMVVAGPRGGPLERSGAVPRALFGHEVAHGWTTSSGAGRNLLSEGWAMFAEGVLIGETHGAEAERRFWEWMRASYLTEGHEGRNTLIGDDFNSGVSYAKGGWVLRMLEDAMGREPFDRGMRAFMMAPRDADNSVEAFAGAMSASAGWDVATFLRPWLEESRIPSLSARIEHGRLIVRQDGPIYKLPVDIELHGTGGDITLHRVWIGQREDTVALEGAAPVRVRLDPAHRLLIQRGEGDLVSFAVNAPDANEVVLRGSFTSSPIHPSRDSSGRWRVELPISEGSYSYFWMVDGARRDDANGGVLEVAPISTLDRASAYPR